MFSPYTRSFEVSITYQAPPFFTTIKGIRKGGRKRCFSGSYVLRFGLFQNFDKTSFFSLSSTLSNYLQLKQRCKLSPLTICNRTTDTLLPPFFVLVIQKLNRTSPPPSTSSFLRWCGTLGHYFIPETFLTKEKKKMESFLVVDKYNFSDV